MAVVGSPLVGAMVTVTTGDAASRAAVQIGDAAPATVNCSAALTLSDGAYTSRPSTVSFGVSSSACESARSPRTWVRRQLIPSWSGKRHRIAPAGTQRRHALAH